MSTNVDFRKIESKFDTNICTLRIFNNQIGSLAEEHDKKASTQQTEEFAKLVGLSTEELEILHDIPDQDYQEAVKRKIENPSEQTGIGSSSKLTDEQNAAISKIAKMNDTEFIMRSMYFIKKTMKILPIQAFILRRSTLITLSSYLEYLIAELIHSFYSLYPQALPSDERVLSLADLREIGSIEEAENELIAREIDALLRNNLEKQLDYISKRPKVDLEALVPYKNRLIEIDQRRNIFVHNEGIVNKTYLARVSPDLVESETKDGTRLVITEEYLNQAIDLVHVCGTMLIQLCWRKWQKANSEAADDFYIDLIYLALQEKEYEFIMKLQDFSTNLAYATDRSKRVIVVNHAIALREQDRPDEMEQIIGTLDWTSCSLEFRAALMALRKDEAKLLKILPKAIAAKEITRFALEEWPLFAPFRQSPDYLKILESCPKGIDLSEIDVG